MNCICQTPEEQLSKLCIEHYRNVETHSWKWNYQLLAHSGPYPKSPLAVTNLVSRHGSLDRRPKHVFKKYLYTCGHWLQEFKLLSCPCYSLALSSVLLALQFPGVQTPASYFQLIKNCLNNPFSQSDIMQNCMSPCAFKLSFPCSRR